MALIVGKGLGQTMLTSFLVMLALCLPALAGLTIERIAATASDRFYLTEGCEVNTCSRYKGEAVVEDSCQCICAANLSTFSVHQQRCIDAIPDCTDLSFSQDNSKTIFTLLVNRNYQLSPDLPVLIHSSAMESRLEKEQCLKSNPSLEAYYEIETGFIAAMPSLIYLETRRNETFIRFNQSHISDEWTWKPNGKLFKLVINCTTHTSAVTNICLAFKTNGDQQGIYTANAAEMSVAEKPSSAIKESTRIAFIVGGSILGVVILASIITTGIILGYKKKSPADTSSSLIRVDRMKSLSLNFGLKHPMTSLIRNQSLPPTLRDPTIPVVKKTHRWGSGSSSAESADSGRGKSRTPSTVAAITATSHPPVPVDNPHDQSLPKQPNLFQSQAQKLTTVANGMTSIVERSGDERSPQHRKKTLRSVIRRFFGGKRLSHTKSDSKLSIDYEHFYITEAPRTKRFSDGHVNPEINFNEEGKISQTEDMEMEPTATDKEFHHSNTGTYDISRPTESDAFPSQSLPITSIDDVDVISDFDAY